MRARQRPIGVPFVLIFETGKAYESVAACFNRSDGIHHSTAGLVLVIQ